MVVNMNKRKFLIASILTIFLCGMLLAGVGAAHAKTVTMYPKMDKTVTKTVGKNKIYKIQVLKWKSSTYQELDVMPYKRGKLFRLNKYKVKTYYKYNNKLKTTKWERGVPGEATYYKLLLPKKAKIIKVQIKY